MKKTPFSSLSFPSLPSLLLPFPPFPQPTAPPFQPHPLPLPPSTAPPPPTSSTCNGRRPIPITPNTNGHLPLQIRRLHSSPPSPSFTLNTQRPPPLHPASPSFTLNFGFSGQDSSQADGDPPSPLPKIPSPWTARKEDGGDWAIGDRTREPASRSRASTHNSSLPLSSTKLLKSASDLPMDLRKPQRAKGRNGGVGLN